MSPNAGRVVRGLSQWVQLCTLSPANRDPTPYLTYGYTDIHTVCSKKLTGLWCLASCSSWGCVSRRSSSLASGRTCPAAASHFLKNVDFRAFSHHFLVFSCRKTLYLPLNAETISLFFREEQSPSPVQLLVWSKASHSAPPLAAGWITWRDRRATPRPQLESQLDQLLHSLSRQSITGTKKEILSTWKNFKLYKYIFFSLKILENTSQSTKSSS